MYLKFAQIQIYIWSVNYCAGVFNYKLMCCLWRHARSSTKRFIHFVMAHIFHYSWYEFLSIRLMNIQLKHTHEKKTDIRLLFTIMICNKIYITLCNSIMLLTFIIFRKRHHLSRTTSIHLWQCVVIRKHKRLFVVHFQGNSSFYGLTGRLQYVDQYSCPLAVHNEQWRRNH